MSKKKNTQGILPPKRLLFVSHWQGDAVAAARAAGYKHPEQEGARLLADPHVKAAIEAKQKAIIESAGQEIGKAIGQSITKDMIANRAWDISQAPADVMGMYSSQINALKFLTELLGYSAGNNEGEVKHGVIKRPDGGVEVYQSQWVKRSEQQPGSSS